MRETTLRLEAAGISQERYKELLYFCYQYPQKKARLRGTLDGILSARPLDGCGSARGGQPGDPTLAIVARRDALARDCELIERAVQDAAGDAYGAQTHHLLSFLLENVTSRDKRPIDLAPCGRRQFYAIRRRFFMLLDARREV